METLGTVLIVAIIFYGAYNLIKVYSDYLLKRKIVKSGHVDKAGIMDPPKLQDGESVRYPSLKWGLVALMAGIGLILIEVLDRTGAFMWRETFDSFLPFGIELVAISLGFLIYFFIVNARTMKNR